MRLEVAATALAIVLIAPAAGATSNGRTAYDVTPVHAAPVPSESASPDTSAPQPGFVQRVTICGPSGCLEPAIPLCSSESLFVQISGWFPNGCYDFNGIEVQYPVDPYAPPVILVHYADHSCQGVCTMAPVRLQAFVRLAPMPAGAYQLRVIEMPSGCSTAPIERAPTPFVVSRCDSTPGPRALPFVEDVRICPNSNTRVCGPICPTDSISVAISGTLPACYFIRRVDIVPPPPSVREAAPTIRLVVDNGCCVLAICPPGPNPFTTQIRIPPMSAGSHDLPIQVAVVCCSDSIRDGDLPTGHFAFQVVDSCGAIPVEPCLVGGWDHQPGECDAYIADGSPARVTFAVQSTMALAGLQGELYVSWPVPAGTADVIGSAYISSLRPVGYASGMRLTWTQSRNGARFVMFSEEGAPIPPAMPYGNTRINVLEVTLSVPQGQTPPHGIAIFADQLLGSDGVGNAVPTCPLRSDTEPRLAPDVARICTGAGCDFNQDGLANVRDLVTMVRCLRLDDCTDRMRFDCDHDGGFDLDDVLCCAWKVLRVPRCDDCPPDTTTPRDEPGVALRLDAPVIDGAEIEAPLSLTGADRVGGVRFELKFPSSRYDFVGLEGVGSEWLALSEARGDAIVVGLIRLGEPTGDAVQSGSVTGVIRLRLKSGGSPGGELSAASAQFSGPDGVPLVATLDATPHALSSGLAFALSENQPDPFSGTTRFSLTMPTAGEGELAVYDIGGRRVATIHRGRLEPGINDFTWDGHADNGARVASGVYFYRATAAGRTLSKKMVVLKE